MLPSVTSTALTRGVRVSVTSSFLPDESAPTSERFVFAYHVTIANEGRETVQLRTRHWVITDSAGRVQEVRGAGVVGAQPVLEPGQSFEYTSFCVLPTPRGTMTGSYQMIVGEGGDEFDAEIAPFLLSMPNALN